MSHSDELEPRRAIGRSVRVYRVTGYFDGREHGELLCCFDQEFAAARPSQAKKAAERLGVSGLRIDGVERIRSL